MEEESAAAAKRAAEEAELCEIFRLADADRSGYIDEAELLDLGRAVNASFTPQKCRALLGRMDTSRDGQVSNLLWNLLEPSIEPSTEPSTEPSIEPSIEQD